MSEEEKAELLAEITRQLGEGRNVNNHVVPITSAATILVAVLGAMLFIGDRVSAIETKIDHNYFAMESAIASIRHELQISKMELEQRAAASWKLYDMADYSAEASILLGKQLPDPKRIAAQNQEFNGRKQ